MSFVTRGFGGGSRDRDDRLPPGQTLVQDFPVLSAGPTPEVDTGEWEFRIITEAGTHRWSWDEFNALPSEDIATDIHCVTHWSKLGTSWRGVSLDTLFENVESQFDYVMARSYGGYTTNVPLDELLDGQAWVATEFDGEPLDPEHGGPARLLVPHLYFWKSAKWVRSLVMMPRDDPGFWEQNGYHLHGDPWQEERYW
ncbi:DMSO/TMAO reductase YedYZ molybdopterin-dependent catalytic subunit [Agromyces terreus]|uniref:DMSO/TMAO reductase YedYZ molybdopterin-dependent catalytic subunit n=1 Tax=Agromyces terreus TaxID=424795 RepID=A0A9X2H635_9MICO|nr:molybdopterin-dependent oxidoreductase [Agromyces terreus]MCP2370714.1 DMSO/TMAO reductase YedYZ molybdopterin-dependent catalytic subunit [Agromyces terreus]